MRLHPRHTGICLKSATIIAALLLMWGCTAGDTPAEEPAGESLYLKFTIATNQAPDTRAVDPSTEHEEPGCDYENALDVDNMTYMLFDRNRRYLLTLSPADVMKKPTPINAELTLYEVVVRVNDPYIEESLKGTVDFYIMVIANTADWGISIPAPSRGDNISTIFDNGVVMTALPDVAKLQKATDSSASARQYFPMTGLQQFSVSGFQLQTSMEDVNGAYNISDATGKVVNMLRAIAKIEIVDKINIAEDAVFDPETDTQGLRGSLRISGVTLNGYFTQGRMLPQLSEWNQTTLESRQVHATALPSTAEYATPPTLSADNTVGSSAGLTGYEMAFAYDAAATDSRSDKCPVFSAYTFEYRYESVSGKQTPYFTVTTKGYNSGSTSQPSLKLPMRMADYTNGTAGSPTQSLVRNHIYRFEVTGISTTNTLVWTVCDMDQASASITFK